MLAAVFVLVSSASAVTPWSAAQRIPGAIPLPPGYAQSYGPGLLGFTPGGAGLAVTGRDAGGRGIARFSAAQGTFGSPRASSLGGVAPSRMALFGREAVILGGQANASGDRRSTQNPDVLLDAAVTRGSVSGSFSRRQVLARGVQTRYGNFSAAAVTALAANPAGDAAAVVSVPVLGRVNIAGHESRLFLRRRGQSSFRKVADIGVQTFGKSPAALAVNAMGDVLVAWDDRTSVRARLVSASGRIGREQRLGQGGSAFGGERLVAAMDGTRRMLVAWMAQSAGESTAGGPGIVALAYASPYKAFRPAQVVQRNLPRGWDRGIGGPAVQAALLRDRGVVLWTGYTGGRYAVRTVDVTSGRASSPRELTPAGVGAQLRGMAFTPRGGTVAAWSRWCGEGATPPTVLPGLYAVARAAGGTSWGPAETVAPTVDCPGPVIAANPVSGQAVLLWEDQLTPAANPPSLTYSVRSSG